MSRYFSNRRIQIDTGDTPEPEPVPRYDYADDDTPDDDGAEINDGLRLRPSNSNVIENLQPFMGVKVRRRASRLRDYIGDYIDVPSRPHLMKILDKQGLTSLAIFWISVLIDVM